MSDRPRLVARLEVIPHTSQRYDTAGDWQQVGLTTALIRASDLGNTDYEFLVLLHELVEWYLCSRRGIREAAVDAFDTAYEGDDPGDDPAAPYHLEHVVAGLVERVVAHELGIEWADYEAAFDRLPPWQSPVRLGSAQALAAESRRVWEGIDRQVEGAPWPWPEVEVKPEPPTQQTGSSPPPTVSGPAPEPQESRQVLPWPGVEVKPDCESWWGLRRRGSPRESTWCQGRVSRLHRCILGVLHEGVHRCECGQEVSGDG